MDRPEMSAITETLAVENTRLRDENAELREMVKELIHSSEHSGGFFNCPMCVAIDKAKTLTKGTL